MQTSMKGRQTRISVWRAKEENADAGDLARLLRLGGERRGEEHRTCASEERAAGYHAVPAVHRGGEAWGEDGSTRRREIGRVPAKVDARPSISSPLTVISPPIQPLESLKRNTSPATLPS